MIDSKAYSRPVAVAERLTGNPSAGQFLGQRALLTGDRQALLTKAGRSCFLAAISLLTRTCSDLTVCIPGGVEPFTPKVQELVLRVHYAGKIEIVRPEECNYSQYHAVLNVGNTQRPDLPWTCIACDGWLLQVSSLGRPVRLSFKNFNPASSLGAASLGVSEVFKRLLGVMPSRGPLFGGETFSLLTYNVDDHVGPHIDRMMRLDCILVGAGAIGNGICHVLRELPLEGWFAVVDRQLAGTENWGTYIDLSSSGFGLPKANIACAGWSELVRARPFPIDIEHFIQKIGGEVPAADLVLGALDNVDGRHLVQQLWPDNAIDGAIGDFSCQVSRHPWSEDVACLQCLFRHPPGESALVVASRLTGLPIARVANPLDIVTDADIDAVQEDKKNMLMVNKGKQICSVVREALAREVANRNDDDHFSPSAPFVACLSGSMVAAEFIKNRMGLATPLAPRFQFDILRGPSNGMLFDEGRRPECACVSRRLSIERWRTLVRQSRYVGQS